MASGNTATIKFRPEDRIAELKSRQRKIERLMVGITMFIFCGISAFVLIPSEAYDSTSAWISRMENGGVVSRNIATNCRDPRNRNTAYCLDRAAELDSDWRAISRHQGGKANQFTLTGR